MVSTAEIEFFCARGHVPRVTFSAKALFDVPATWECEVCHLTATRIPPDVKSVDTRVSSTSIPEGGAASSSDTEADKTSQADDASHSGDTIQPDGMSQPEDGPATVRSTDTPSRHLLDAQARRGEAEREEILRTALERLQQQ